MFQNFRSVGHSLSLQLFLGNSLAQAQIISPVNGDPFVGMLETPVTSAPIVATYLSNLPAYRTGVAPLLRGVEIGLAHGFLLAGPFIKASKVASALPAPLITTDGRLPFISKRNVENVSSAHVSDFISHSMEYSES